MWHVPFLGFISSLYFFIWGALFTVTGIGAPLGLGLIKIGKMLLAPFGKAVVRNGQYGLNLKKGSDKFNKALVAYEKFEFIFRIVWFPFGLFTAGIVLAGAIANALTIINIPISLVLIEVAKACFNPVGIYIVDSELVIAAKQRSIQTQLEKSAA